MRSSTLKNLASFFSKSDVLAENDFVKIWMGLWYGIQNKEEGRGGNERREHIEEGLRRGREHLSLICNSNVDVR